MHTLNAGSGGHAPAAERMERKTPNPRPPPQSPAAERTRRWILLSFWAVVVCLGLPLWIWTTSIHRSDLPLETMDRWADGKTCDIRYPLHVRLSAPALGAETGAALALRTQEALREVANLRLYDVQVSYGTYNDTDPPDSDRDWVLAVRLEQADVSHLQARLRSWIPVLDVSHGPSAASDIDSLASFICDQVRKVFEDEQASLSYLLSQSPFATGRETLLPPDTKAILDARTTKAFKYATTYHLTFSLFTSSASPSAWDISEAIDQYLKPLVTALSQINQFTIDSQVQLHASFSPSIAGPQFDAASGKWQLQKTDLSGFINAAEWPLSPSIGAGPTMNFVLYVPSSEQSPLEIAETGGTSWLIPQWGGVQIFNPTSTHGNRLTAEDLEPAMLIFADQLTALVGLPPSPPSLSVRLSSLTRERATSLILSASSTLGALSRLTLKLTSIAIPDSVATSVDDTIRRLDQACSDLREGRFDDALENARIANDEAERAFFEPSMVGQVYFPDEHKVAVYVPLLGPMAVPMVIAGLKELRTLRTGKRKAA